MSEPTAQEPTVVQNVPRDPVVTVDIGYNWKAATPNLNLALAKARGEFPPIPKTKTAKVYKKDQPSVLLYTFKFADLADVMEAVKAALAKYELAVTHTTGPGQSGLVLESFIRHSSGEMLRSLMPMPFMDGRPQDWGSHLTYLRRYLVSAMLGVASDEDDDGNAASGNPREIEGNETKGKSAPAAKQNAPAKDQSKAAPKAAAQTPPPTIGIAGPELMKDLQDVMAARGVSEDQVREVLANGFGIKPPSVGPFLLPEKVTKEIVTFLFSPDASPESFKLYGENLAKERATPPATSSRKKGNDPGAHIVTLGSDDVKGKRVDQLNESTLKKIIAWCATEMKKTPPSKNVGEIMDLSRNVKAFLENVGVKV